jgi:hypothetical protein
MLFYNANVKYDSIILKYLFFFCSIYNNPLPFLFVYIHSQLIYIICKLFVCYPLVNLYNHIQIINNILMGLVFINIKIY